MNIADIVASDHLPLAQQMIRYKRGDERLTTVYELDIVTKDGRRVPIAPATIPTSPARTPLSTAEVPAATTPNAPRVARGR